MTCEFECREREKCDRVQIWPEDNWCEKCLLSHNCQMCVHANDCQQSPYYRYASVWED